MNINFNQSRQVSFGMDPRKTDGVIRNIAQSALAVKILEEAKGKRISPVVYLLNNNPHSDDQKLTAYLTTALGNTRLAVGFIKQAVKDIMKGKDLRREGRYAVIADNKRFPDFFKFPGEV